MKKKSKVILFAVLIAVLLFGGLCVYLATDYTRRCVRLTPKNDILVVEVGKTYGIEEFFKIEKEKNTKGRIIEILWEDGSTENIVIDEDGHFTITGGTGTLIISLRDRNSDSPEESSASVTVTVEDKSAGAQGGTE